MDIPLQRYYGFTLIESVIVLAIIGIIGIYALFSLQDVTINLQGQAEQLANDIRYAQFLAMTKGQRYRWVKTSGNTYQIQNNSGTPITLAQGNTTVTFNGSITFGTFSNLPNSLVAFNGKGVPYTDTASPGTALASNATIPITSGGQTQTVQITPNTGRIILQ